MSRRILVLALLGSAFLIPAMEVRAQTVTLDEGTFRISIDGQPAGTESFAIRRVGSGDEARVLATAEIDLVAPEGRLDLRPVLEASGSDMAVTGYQIKLSGQQQQEIYMRLEDRRFAVRILSERGTQEREVRAVPGTLLLDTGVAHQYYFVARLASPAGVTFPAYVPREGRQFELRVSEVGQESLTIGDRTVSARRLRVEGNQEVRELWVDGEGRVLRVDHAAQGYSAVRESAP